MIRIITNTTIYTITLVSFIIVFAYVLVLGFACDIINIFMKSGKIRMAYVNHVATIASAWLNWGKWLESYLE